MSHLREYYLSLSKVETCTVKNVYSYCSSYVENFHKIIAAGKLELIKSSFFLSDS